STPPARTSAAGSSRCASWPARSPPPERPTRPCRWPPRRLGSRTGLGRSAGGPRVTRWSSRYRDRPRRSGVPRHQNPVPSTLPAGETGPSPGRRIFVLVDEPLPAVAPPVVPGLTGLTVLARGGYATVYRAVQESIGRDVAVKIENRSLDNEHDRRRFMREA